MYINIKYTTTEEHTNFKSLDTNFSHMNMNDLQSQYLEIMDKLYTHTQPLQTNTHKYEMKK